jgi:hypothetical protein
MLASAFGGGDELGYVEFAPGKGSLTPEAQAKLTTWAKRLMIGLRLNLKSSALSTL